MHVEELMTIYEKDRNEPPASINHLLDYYQHLYISERIDIAEYMKVFSYLSKQGARNAHANLESER